jgi:hypothetical protein
MSSDQPIRINAKTCAARIVASSPVWEVAMHMPTVRVRVEATSRDEAHAAALSLTPEDFAEALIRRLQYTKPKAGDIIGTHPVGRDRERSLA